MSLQDVKQLLMDTNDDNPIANSDSIILKIVDMYYTLLKIDDLNPKRHTKFKFALVGVYKDGTNDDITLYHLKVTGCQDTKALFDILSSDLSVTSVDIFCVNVSQA